MLIVTAVNVTKEKGKRTLVRKNGTADYIVEVAINRAPPIWAGPVTNHIRDEGASALLRRIADRMDAEE
jgi:hypothetical protein